MSDRQAVNKSEKSCEACRDTGWVTITEEGVSRKARCPDCSLRKLKARLLADAEIPSIYADQNFELFARGDPSQAEAVARTIDFLERFPDVERGILFVGPCGVGKTHLSVALLKALVNEKLVHGRFVDEAELLSRLQHSYSADNRESEERILERLKTADLLVWDDLGTGRPTEWAKSKISEVINHRYTHCKWTVMSSNYPMPGSGKKWSRLQGSSTLEERVGARLFSRIMEMCEVIEIDGADARIEIHKARLDFKASRKGTRSSLIPVDKLSCPRCSSPRITVQDEFRSTPGKPGACINVSALCAECGNLFEARYNLKSGEVDFPA